MSEPQVARPAFAVSAPVRFVGFTAATFLAGAVGRATYDESLDLSLVWPIYGVVILWLATGSRASWPWDAVGMSIAVAASVLSDGANWQETIVATSLAAPMAGLWLVIMRRLAPDVLGGGGTRPLERLSDLNAFLVASIVTAVTAAFLRSSGLGLVPLVPSLEELMLTAIRNLSWILALGGLGLLLPGVGSTRRRGSGVGGGTNRWSLNLTIETVLVAAATILLAASAFAPTPTPLTFALVLSAVWTGFRLPSIAGALLALTLGTIAVLVTLAGRGAFTAGESDFEAAAVAQAFLITLVLTTLAIAFATDERREATDRAARAEHDAEARAAMFSTVIEHLAEGVTVIDAEDTYTVRNPAARRMTGSGGFLQPDPDDPERTVMVSASGEPIARQEMPHSRARMGEEVIRETVMVRTRQGIQRQLQITSVPVRVQEDEPIVVNTLRDVTSEHEERDQLVAFAGVVAHDLKNPLTIIQGWSESLQEELSADRPLDVNTLRSMVERVQNASDQMTTFIDDLLNITVARDRPLDLGPLDLSTLAEEVAELRRTGETQARIAVQPGMVVTGDRFLVRQLLDNLIGNAVKYVAAEVRPAVTVAAAEVGEELEVSITDNGVGIPAESQQRVFDSFVRAHGAAYTGTGLGLAICARVVSRHGGRIWVAEHDGPGTRIIFTLPRG